MKELEFLNHLINVKSELFKLISEEKPELLIECLELSHQFDEIKASHEAKTFFMIVTGLSLTIESMKIQIKQN